MNKYRNRNERPKAFIGSVISAGISSAVGAAKGIAGMIAKRKQARKEQQQNYVNAVMQSKQGMDEELQAAAELAGQFEEKFVARCGGRYRSKGVRMACGGSKKKACGGRRKAVNGTVGTISTGSTFNTQAINAPSMNQGNPMNINALNNDLQKFNAQTQGSGITKEGSTSGLSASGSMFESGAAAPMEIAQMFMKGPKQFSTYKPNVRTQPLSNINTNKDVNNIPNNGATTDAMALPNGALQRPTAMCGTRKRGKFGTRRRSC